MNTAYNVRICILILGGLGTLLPAQTPADIFIGPAPAWPGDHALASDLNGNRVFLDMAKHEIVILSHDTHTKGPTTGVSRIPLPGQVDLVMTSNVTPDPGGFRYTYTVANGPAALKPLRSFRMLLPSDAQIVAGPWQSTRHGRHPVAGGAQLQEAEAVVFQMAGPTTIARGAPGGSFQLTSSFLPGLVPVRASVSDYPEVPSTWASELPEDVQRELSRVLDWSDRAMHQVVVAPAYSPSDPKPVIAMDFKRSLALLVSSGSLNDDSEFVQDVRTALDYIMTDNDGIASLQGLRFESAKEGLESQIAVALKLALAR